MALQNVLNDSLTKERGGRHGGKGHEFQRYWAVCHLLKLDLENQDFLMLVEFIEDVAVLDNAHTPTTIELFQLKKKEGSAKWTKAALLQKKKSTSAGKSAGTKDLTDAATSSNAAMSVLAKLHESRNVKKNETKSITFVSNAPIDLKLADSSDSTARTEIKGCDIESTVSQALRQSVATELGCAEGDVNFNDFIFARSSLAIDDLEKHAMGHVASYLANKFPENSVRADVLCKALYSEIRVKATSTEDAAEFDDLKRIRGISKSQFGAMLSLTLAKKPDTAIVEGILTTLTHEQLPYVKRNAIKQALRRFLIDKAGKGVTSLEHLLGIVEVNLGAVPSTLVTSWDVATWIVQQMLLQGDANILAVVDEDYLMALALFRMNQ
jgi:hypothetical protein